MTITTESIIEISKIIGAIGIIAGAVIAIVKAYVKYKNQQKAIEALEEQEKEQKEELTLLCFGLSACLDGLQQLGANHTVPVAKDKLDKYLNVHAHK